MDSIPLYPMETTGSEELDRVLNIIFSQIITEDMDTHDKLKACYDYIIQNTEYVAPACGGEPYYSAYGVFMVGEGICDTYSAAYAVMARKIGVPLYLAGVLIRFISIWPEHFGHRICTYLLCRFFHYTMV